MAKGDLSFQIDRKDWEETEKMLTSLQQIDVKAAPQLKNAFMAGEAMVVNEGQRLLSARNKPHKGHLQKSFTIKVNVAKMKANAGFKRGKGGGNHAHLVDSGTAKRWTKKGYYRGSVSKNNPKHGSKFWTDANKHTLPHAGQFLLERVEFWIKDMYRQYTSRTSSLKK